MPKLERRPDAGIGMHVCGLREQLETAEMD